MEELLDTYEKNVGAFFGKLFGNDDFAEIKMTLTARDVWNKAVEKWGEDDVRFVWDKIISDSHLQRILPESVRIKITTPDFERSASNLVRLINTISSPDRPEDIIFFQRTFNEGIDPLAAIGGYYKQEFQERFPDVAALLMAETKAAHQKGPGKLAFEASQLAKTGTTFSGMTPQEQAVLIWTNTAVLSELYGSDVSSKPGLKWEEQVEPFTTILARLLEQRYDLKNQSEVKATQETWGQLQQLTFSAPLDFTAYQENMRIILEAGAVSLTDRELFDACVKFEQLKPGQVIREAGHPMEGLFYADTAQYPYVTMAFQGERIGIQRASTEGGRFGHGETSMSLPPEITAELFAQFPFLDKNLKITLRGDGMDYDVPISGPSATYIYINEGQFFDQPDLSYTYTVGGETRSVKPREILDFLRQKRSELAGAE